MRLIKIRQPVSRVTDGAPAGTILDQNPPPNTPLDGVVQLELVVSKGPRGDLLELEDYVAQPFAEVRDQLAEINLPFVFRVRAAQDEEEPGTVVSQSPKAGEEIPYSSILQLEMTPPAELEEGLVFGLLELSLQEYPILVEIKLEVITPTETRTILEMDHPAARSPSRTSPRRAANWYSPASATTSSPSRYVPTARKCPKCRCRVECHSAVQYPLGGTRASYSGYYPSFPSSRRGFDSLRSLLSEGPCAACCRDTDTKRGKGSHITLYYGDHKTIVKDQRKEIGAGLLSAMIRQLGLERSDFQ